MSIIKKNKYILYLIKDLRTDNQYYQVVGKIKKPMFVGQYFDIKCDLADSEQEWVLGKVTAIVGNVITFIIVKECK